MFIKSIITGSVITAILVSVLAATRLVRDDSNIPDVLLYEVERVFITPEPELPIEEEQEEENEFEETLPQAPIPAMDLISDTSVDSIPLPLTTVTFDPKLSVDVFAIDRDPADLPVANTTKKIKIKAEAPIKKRPKINVKSPKPVREKIRSHYSPSQLDRKPRELRRGKFNWPSSLTIKRGSVKLMVEINTSGRVRVISVSKAGHPKLISAAKQVARSSRYTVPTYKGKPVSTKFYKTYHLQKPRR